MGEPCSRPARVSRGSVTMSEITHTASSPESGSWVETIPPVERAAAMSEAAPPPDDFSRERAWGSAPSGDDGAADYTTFGPNNPDWLEADPQGTLGCNYPQGLDTATWAAASPVGSQSLGTQRSALSGDDGAADYTTFGPNNPDWLEADPQGTLGCNYPQGLDTATWAAASPVGSQSLGTQRSAPSGDDGAADYTTTGLDGPPETWPCGASDHDGNANAASHVKINTAGAHVPAGMHETYDIVAASSRSSSARLPLGVAASDGDGALL